MTTLQLLTTRPLPPVWAKGEDRQQSSPAGADKVTKHFPTLRRSVLTPHKNLAIGIFF